MSSHDLALAYALSTVAGLRSVLTLLAISVAIHAHAIAAPAVAPWLAGDSTLAILAVLAGLDALGDKIPLVDHLLHAAHTVLAPLVGAASVASVVPGGGDPLLTTLAVLGGANALGIHALRGTTRVATNTMSLGVLTPFVSLAGDVLALGALVTAFVAPYAAALVASIATIIAVAVLRRLRFVRRSAEVNGAHARVGGERVGRP